MPRLSFKLNFPEDQCCHSIYYGDKYIGHWCAKSQLVVVDEKIIGLSQSLEDILKNLKQKEITRMEWCYE